MSLMDRHDIGMLSSVMRALKHMEAAVRSAMGVAMRPVVQPVAV